MAVSKDFRVKKGLVVGENVDARSGNVSAVNVNASGTFTAGTFEPSNVTATSSVSSPSISADNFYGNITDATYSDLSISGTTSASSIFFDSGTSTTADSTQWYTGGVTMSASHANVGDGTPYALFTIPKAKYRSGKCVIQAVAVGVGTSMDTAHQEITEILFIHNGTTANMIEYATVGIGTTTIASYSAAINGANLEIRATAASPSNSFVHFTGSITQLHTTLV
tara:strand:- start:82 stop:753 length:672 start_codon:yes stop_codon:yes gene_type:complete